MPSCLGGSGADRLATKYEIAPPTAMTATIVHGTHLGVGLTGLAKGAGGGGSGIAGNG
jgi:hypothetical protein